MYHDLGDEGDPARVPARRSCPLEDREVSQVARAELHQARHHGHDQRPLRRRRRSRSTKDGVCLMVGPEGKEPAEELRAEQMLVADRPGRQHRGHRARDDQGRGRARLHQGRRPDADEGAARLRDRRRRSAACARPHRRPRGDRRGPHDRRRQGRPRDRLHQAAAGDLLPAGDRLDRPDRGSSARSAACPIKVGKVPFQAIAKAIIGGEYEGFAKVIADKETDDTLGVHIDRAARHRPHRRGVARRSSSRRRRGRSAARPTPTRRSPRSSARRRWPSTAGRSTSDHGGRHDARRPDQRRGKRRRTSAPTSA